MRKTTTVSDTTILCSVLTTKVREYFSDQEHRAAFEEWYERKYGKKYVWKQK